MSRPSGEQWRSEALVVRDREELMRVGGEMHVRTVDAEGGGLSRFAGGRRVRVLALTVIASERTMDAQDLWWWWWAGMPCLHGI